MVEMCYLPVDMIKEILLRLPVKSLLRFRCVSKDWRYLITNSLFINQHHNRSIEQKPNLILTDTASFYKVKDNSCQKLDIPYLNSLDWWYKITVLGSCNSLLCFVLTAPGEFPVTIHYNEPIYLMNPSTRKVKKLPSVLCEIPQFTYWKTRIGFGYDPISKDYKVVLIVYFNMMSRSSNVWVYSLNSNNWRKLGDIPVPDLYPNIYNHSQTPVAINGAIHWLVFGENELDASLWDSIYSFDLVHEVFRELPLPPGRGYYTDLVVMRGYLTILRDPADRISHEIWMMKEYGVKESWTKQTILLNAYIQVHFWNEETLIQCYRNGVVLHNIKSKSKTERNHGVNGLPINFKTFVHTESLIMLEDTR